MSVRASLRLVSVFFFLLTFPALACNLPVAPQETSAGTPDLPAPVKTADSAMPVETVRVPVLVQHFRGLRLPRDFNAPLPLDTYAGSGEQFPYVTQPGDTLDAIRRRFRLDSTASLILPQPLEEFAYLPAGLEMQVPVFFSQTLTGAALFPDSEVVYGPPSAGFDVETWVAQTQGFLSRYSETVDGETLSGAQIVRRVALETSINPRLLLAVLEWRSGWVLGEPAGGNPEHPLGFDAPSHVGLYRELLLSTRFLTMGYYGWRGGTLEQIEFASGDAYPPSPFLNAGSVAVQNLGAKFTGDLSRWANSLYGEQGLLAVYVRLFGSPWENALPYEPHLPAREAWNEPAWELPFPEGEAWSFTGGPHVAWGLGSPRGALDFAPIEQPKGCSTSTRWATASAAGVVARSERGALVLDTDGDGQEQTGWTLLYLHLADEGRLPVGSSVQVNDRLGHPSCEGGIATGRHVHIVRRYNGEWIGVSPVTPFVLSGWEVQAGELAYQGRLVKGEALVTAKPDGSVEARIQR
ncbi:hypothetical protein ANT_30940 [Anaerolinea thermophila UNI-1]|uniref:LysM domain-containing protein n=1 Tax=Anaerolinea thermophila (strain DSM 14523 / JCM 11388 / NBRC 100420 / UNI-1) TaxID=926569 RepID=E8N2X0_ANATU|nr:hypothetical protein ANT_30940 [Anaerolinea thermophila UNI-1]